MSHPEQLKFFDIVAKANAALVEGARVLEIGSYDVNGSIRGSFRSAKEYVGVDLTPGPGVDVVCHGHEVDLPDGSFEIALSGECFEHDPHWEKTFRRMTGLVVPGGLVAVSCASAGRAEHGTTRSDHRQSPGTQAVGYDYYRNLTRGDFESSPSLLADFAEYRFWYVPTSMDLYFVGVKAGNPRSVAELPGDEIDAIRAMMGRQDKIIRLPLRYGRFILSRKMAQDFSVWYWPKAFRVSRKVTEWRMRRAVGI